MVWYALEKRKTNTAMKTPLRLLAALLFATSTLAADPVVIYQTDGTLNDTGGLNGTTRGLSVNLPGAVWKCGTIWNWSTPQWTYSYKDLGYVVNCGEEYAGAVLPLLSTNNYVRPDLIQLDVSFYSTGGACCFGFWDAADFHMANVVEEDGETRSSNVGGTITCGIVYSSTDRTLQIAEGGALKGSAVAVVAEDPNGIHSISILVDTVSGSLLQIKWNGAIVQGLASSAFTAENTRFVGCAARPGGRICFGNFTVSEGAVPDPAPVVSVETMNAQGFVGSPISFAVSAVLADTEQACPVTVSAEGISGYSLENGVFTWTPTEEGMFPVNFSSVYGNESDSKTVRIWAYNTPAVLGYRKPILQTDQDLVMGSVNYAGMTWTNEASRTSYGLAANLPEAVWIWNSGYDWARPTTSSSSKSFSLGNELGSVLLSLASTNAYVKPAKMRYFARFAPMGWVLFGFWNRPRDIAGGESALAPTAGFTGIRIAMLAQQLQLYSAGTSVATVPLYADTALTSHTLEFCVNTRTSTLERLILDGYPVLDVPSNAISLTDASTAYVGLGTSSNSNYGNARMSFYEFELDDLVSSSTVVLFR